jgi:uncharacterized membrane protein
MSKSIIVAALGAVLAAGMSAQTMACPGKTKGMERCFGIVKAGKNDCGNAEYACSGNAKTDGERSAWIMLPKGTCDKIVNGTTVPPK